MVVKDSISKINIRYVESIKKELTKLLKNSDSRELTFDEPLEAGYVSEFDHESKEFIIQIQLKEDNTLFYKAVQKFSNYNYGYWRELSTNYNEEDVDVYFKISQKLLDCEYEICD